MSVAAERRGPSRAGAPPRRRPLSSAALRGLAAVVIAAALLALLTIATFLYLPRYQEEGRSVLANADFREGFKDWEYEGLVTLDETELGLVILQNWDPQRAVVLRHTVSLPPGRTSLRLSADIAARRVERGAEDWHTARVYLVQQTAEGSQLWHAPNRLVNLIGTTSRQHFSTVFEVPGTIPEVVLGIELPFAVGRMELANLELEIVDERPSFRLVAALLVCGWSVLAFIVVHRLYDSIRSPTVRGWLLATLCVLPAGAVHAVPAAPAADRCRWRAASACDLSDPDAFGHAMVFGMLALLVRAGRPRDPLVLHLSCWLLLGAVTEVLQLFTPDREPEAGDWLMDALGVERGPRASPSSASSCSAASPRPSARPARPG